jgi:CheY-like chemotaxis protein
MEGAQAATRQRVLIVDDDESMRLLLAGMVSSQLEARVELAGTCEQALRFAEGQPYDAILLDLLMPGIGGFAVLRRVRGSAPNARTPVIVVSADKAAAERALAAGANAFLVKPVQTAEVAALIRKHMEGRTHA